MKKKKEDMKIKKEVGMNKQKDKIYKDEVINKNSMLLGDLKRSPDEFYFKETLVFIDETFLEKLSKHFGKNKYLKFDKILFFEDYLDRFIGYTLNPNIESTNNFPLNSEDATSLSNFDKSENVVSINGGVISNTTIPGCSLGGNNLLLRKCLSNVNITLDSDLDILDICLSLEPNGTFLISYPFFFNNSSTSFGKFSSDRNFGSLLEEDIFFFSNEFGSICQNRKDSCFCELRKIIFRDIFDTDSCSEQFQNLPYHDSCSFESRSSSADFRVCNNVISDINSHKLRGECEIFKSFSLQSIKEILLFPKKPGKFFRQNFITCVLYKGKEKVDMIELYRKKFKGLIK